MKAESLSSAASPAALPAHARISIASLALLHIDPASLPQVQGLYTAAREELDRLDKENGELKGMVQQGVYELPRSR